MSEETLSKVYDWITRVVVRQQRWLAIEDLWNACPFKKEITKEAFTLLVQKMQEATV